VIRSPLSQEYAAAVTWEEDPTCRAGSGPALLLDWSYVPVVEEAKWRNAPGNVRGFFWNSSAWTKVAQIQTVHQKVGYQDEPPG
jgi:hypothetical protein